MPPHSQIAEDFGNPVSAGVCPIAASASSTYRWEPRIRGGIPSAISRMVIGLSGTPYARGYTLDNVVAGHHINGNPVCAGVCRFLAFANASRCWEPRIHGGIPVCRVGSKVHWGSPRVCGDIPLPVLSSISIKPLSPCCRAFFRFVEEQSPCARGYSHHPLVLAVLEEGCPRVCGGIPSSGNSFAHS